MLQLRARTAGGVERRGPRARRAQEARGRAQRVQPRHSGEAQLRRGALQPRASFSRTSATTTARSARPSGRSRSTRTTSRKSSSWRSTSSSRIRSSRSSPDLGGEKRTDGSVEDFALDTVCSIRCSPSWPRWHRLRRARRRLARPTLRRADYLSKGLLDRASAEASRVLARGGDPVKASRCSATCSRSRARTARRSSAIAVPRAAGEMAADQRRNAARASRGSARAHHARPRGEARPLAEDLLNAPRQPMSRYSILAATARARRWGSGGGAGCDSSERAGGALRERTCFKQIGDVARSIGDFESAARVVSSRD